MFITLSLTLLLQTDPTKPPSEGESKAKPSPFAPSLRDLSETEEKKLDAIVDRFIEADLGKLTGVEGDRAKDEFRNLGPDAFFALVRGLNKSAKIDMKCPAVLIAQKLNAQISKSNDVELLQYARENVGAGVGETKHGTVLKQLKLNATLRQNAVKNTPRPNVIGGPEK
jgi:hypothetical protein